MSGDKEYTKDDLLNLRPSHTTIVCIDSDGCVFDTMEIKQKQCFHGQIVKCWGLEPIEKYVREAAEFVNLYSKSRGTNRFPGLYDSIELLRDRPEVIQSGVALPAFTELKKWIDSGAPLGNPALAKEVAHIGNPELTKLLAWSMSVNRCVAAVCKNVPIFNWVRESLEDIRLHSDCIVVSQTPVEALVREWEQHAIDGYVEVIAGQELGTKTQHIQMATAGKYQPDQILMIGDAPGDRKAAKANNALFYPINPTHEDASWERFHKEAYGKFRAGEYRGDYEQSLIEEFEALLPDTPPWKTV